MLFPFFVKLAALVFFFTSSLIWQPQSVAATNNKPLRIAVAANFSPVLKPLIHDFTQQTGIQTQVVTAASGTLFIQIQHGAPFDVFLSADSERPRILAQHGHVLPESVKTYAIGQLAFHSEDKQLNSALISLLQQSDTTTKQHRSLQHTFEQLNRFAIANPAIAPYGKAAKEALENLGLWQILQTKLVTSTNVGQTFTQLQSKSVTAGMVSNSQLVLNNLSGIIIPTGYYQPIEQQLAIIKKTQHHAQAKRFSDFILSNKSQLKIAQSGYITVEKERTLTPLEAINTSSEVGE